MRSTQELREEIFRRAEHKKRATRALYRRMGTLCLLLCLCAGVTVWGMLGQTAPEQSLSTESTVSLQQTLQGDPSLPHMDVFSEVECSAEEEEPSETVSDPGMEDEFLPEEEPSEEEPSDESLADEPEYHPEGDSDSSEPEEEGDAPEVTPLPTVVLLSLPAHTEPQIRFLCTVQGVLTREDKEFCPGDTLEVQMPGHTMASAAEGLLAMGEWQGDVFVIRDYGDCYFLKGATGGVDSVAPEGPSSETPPPPLEPDCGISGECPSDSDESFSELDLMIFNAGLSVPSERLSVEEGEKLFEALKALYQS